ncbi:tyrosyl-DNA phosphodiesterase 2 [Trichomycterus rosablanca]|uniref:tyrosyl-DNA phosphodiesterase 2 n=1 Tax=Trichomycterus rosablanca TaxID=2290929 RepID=UPI002F35F2B6
MEGKQDHGHSPTSTELPAEGDRDSNTILETNATQEKIPVKKKNRARKNRGAKNVSNQTLREQPNHDQSPEKGKVKVKTEHALTQTTTDQSTQTESLQDVSTQSPPLQCIHIHPTESKSTQTIKKRLSYKQVYEGKLEAEEDQISSPDNNRDLEQLMVLTWNIDGLDPEDLRERVPNLLLNLGKYRPDVVLLQELVPPYLNILKEVMTDYDFLQGSEDGYFSGILLRKSRVELLQSTIVKYPTTEMSRNLLMAEATFSGHQLCFMTSHLESMKASSQERMNQIRRVWKRMKEAPDNQTVIFGGDTNLRDKEVNKLGGVPDSITDVWEMLGEPEDCKYTWDTVTNNNNDVTFAARLRFDRVFLRTAKEDAQLKPVSMTLVGLKRLLCGRFISDHWGILCTFSFESSK